MPFVGEAADAYKTAKLGAKIADKASDIYKASKTVDRIYDVVTNPEVQKAIKAAGTYGECLVDGLATGRIYKSQDKSFGTGFANGFISSIISKHVELKTNKTSLRIIGASFGSALGSIVEEFINGNFSETIIFSAAESAVAGILSGAGNEYVKQAITFANDANSAAKVLMKYDKDFGGAICKFFERTFLILGAIDGYKNNQN